MQFIFNFNDSKKFIIEKSSCYNIDNYISNYNAIGKIYNSIITYYNFEKDFSVKLKRADNYLEVENYYLISKNWIDKWKLYYKYEIIKSIFLERGKMNII